MSTQAQPLTLQINTKTIIGTMAALVLAVPATFVLTLVLLVPRLAKADSVQTNNANPMYQVPAGYALVATGGGMCPAGSAAAGAVSGTPVVLSGATYGVLASVLPGNYTNTNTQTSNETNNNYNYDHSFNTKTTTHTHTNTTVTTDSNNNNGSNNNNDSNNTSDSNNTTNNTNTTTNTSSVVSSTSNTDSHNTNNSNNTTTDSNNTNSIVDSTNAINAVSNTVTLPILLP